MGAALSRTATQCTNARSASVPLSKRIGSVFERERVGSLRIWDAAIAEFDHSVSEDDLRQLVGRAAVRTLQCVEPVTDPVWSLLNDVFFAARPDVQLRVYGHYSTECDLSFARRMTHVRRFAADCLMRARNVEAIGELPHLTELSLGIFELQGLDVLDRVAPTLSVLVLGATRSKKPRLESLARFRSLKTLYLEGQGNGIEVLSDLPELEDVTLRSITTTDLNFLAPLRRLWSLDIKLGGIRSFRGIEGKDCLKYLELWQIRELQQADVVASLSGLQNLFLQSLPRVTQLPPLDHCTALRRAVLQNLKGFTDFTAFESAPALEEFSLIEGNRQQPEQLVPVLRNPALRRVSAYFGSDRRNRDFARLRDAHGKLDGGSWTPFEYR